MELQDYTRSLDNGHSSKAAAVDAGDKRWELNASVLIAQSFRECHWNASLESY